jgi:arylsulfatase A-like enzyme
MTHPKSILLVFLALFLTAPAPGAERPNVVYILADDLGYGDLRLLNPSSKIPTPNLDRLAAQGAVFTDAHTGSSLCTPTRYGLLTGRYCWRTSLKRGVLQGYSPPLIEPGRLTVADLLQQNGYTTACVGKWHLGWDWATKGDVALGREVEGVDPPVDFARPVRNGPRSRGFDTFFGISASLDMPPYVFVADDRAIALPTAHQKKQGFVRSGPRDPALSLDAVLPRLTDKAVEFLAEQAKGRPGRPFFLYFPLTAPHTPVAPTPAFRGKGGAGDYGEFVAEVDDAVGRVLQELDDQGLSKDTLVIVTSDNGPERTAYPRARETGHYSMGSLRGVKRDLWEGGHRVPFLARWPGRVAPGRMCDEVVCHTDLMATVADILDVALPADAGEDSVSILPALLGEKRDKPLREATVHHSGSGRLAIRRGAWVFIDAPTGDDNREPDWFKAARGYRSHDEPGELYDLVNDPGERHNLYVERPETVKELKSLLDKYQREGRSVALKP